MNVKLTAWSLLIFSFARLPVALAAKPSDAEVYSCIAWAYKIEKADKDPVLLKPRWADSRVGLLMMERNLLPDVPVESIKPKAEKTAPKLEACKNLVSDFQFLSMIDRIFKQKDRLQVLSDYKTCFRTLLIEDKAARLIGDSAALERLTKEGFALGQLNGILNPKHEMMSEMAKLEKTVLSENHKFPDFLKGKEFKDMKAKCKLFE